MVWILFGGHLCIGDEMTKKEAMKEFREYVLVNIPRGDVCARREAWCNFTDKLNRDRQITDWQNNKWTNPF
jgi:hypothetical protein